METSNAKYLNNISAIGFLATIAYALLAFPRSF